MIRQNTFHLCKQIIKYVNPKFSGILYCIQYEKVKWKSLSHSQLFATPWTVNCRLLCPWNSPGKNTGVGFHFLLQGIFLIQESNLHLLYWQVDSLLLSYQGSPCSWWAAIKHEDACGYVCVLRKGLYHQFLICCIWPRPFPSSSHTAAAGSCVGQDWLIPSVDVIADTYYC